MNQDKKHLNTKEKWKKTFKLLLRQPKTATEISKELEIAYPTILKWINILENENFLKSEYQSRGRLVMLK
jgi:predicted transcriptional regulator